MIKSPRQECGLWSQLGSLEALDPGEGKIVGLLFSSGHFSRSESQSVCPYVEGMAALPPGGNQGQVEWEEVFGLSGGRQDDSNGTMTLRS